MARGGGRSYGEQALRWPQSAARPCNSGCAGVCPETHRGLIIKELPEKARLGIN
jgi:hypothetical protein